MDRREFLTSLAAGGALGAMPMSALAMPGDPLPVLIVGQAELPYAAALASGIARMLAAAGVPCLQATPGGDALGDYSSIVALLEQAPGARVVGVMDDAAALIFQSVAAARGAGYLLQTQHRAGDRDMRHCCNVAGLDSAIVWSGPIATDAARISRLYAETISGKRLAAGADIVTPPLAAALSFVSFVITT